MNWPTRPLTHVDVTAYESTLTNGYESNLTNVYRAAVVFEQMEEITWLVGSDRWLLNLFTWQDDVNAEVGREWQISPICRLLVERSFVLDGTKRFHDKPQGRSVLRNAKRG